MPRLSIKDLIPSQTYHVQIRAVGNSSTSEWSKKFTFVATDDDVPPKVPTGFSWQAANGYFWANWNEVTRNVDESNARIIRYNLALTANGHTEGITVSPTEDGSVRYKLTYARARVMFGNDVTSITAKVRAVNKGSIQGQYTSPLSASLAQPDPPINPVTEPVNDGLNISWDPPLNMDNVDGYRIYLSTNPAFTAAPANMVYQGGATNFSYSTTTYQMHYIKIRSYSNWGTESIDCLTQGVPKSPYGADVIPPDVPTSLLAQLDRSTGVARALLSWSFNDTVDPNKDISNFAIRYKKTSEPTSWRLVFAEKAARTSTIDLPEPYANYEFQISAADTLANYSAWSASTNLLAGIPGNPSVPVVTASAGLGSIQLKWTASSDDVTYGGYYQVEISKDITFATGTLTYKTGNLDIAVTGLDIANVYYYRVKAVDTDGNSSAWSTTGVVETIGLSETPITDGDAPTSSPAPTLTAGINSLFITWTPIDNPDPVTYEIWLSTNSSTGYAKVGETSGSVMTITRDGSNNALTYVPYYAKVMAKDYDGSAAYSSVSSPATPRKAGTGDIISIVADQIATSSLSASVITIDSAGAIQSNNYVANTTGFKISATVVDIQSGVINFGTLRAGTVTTTGLSIGAGGRLTVDSTGSVQSNNYASNSTGWKLSSTGLELNSGTVKASAMTAGTYTGGQFIVGSGGDIRSANYNGSSTGWIISDTALQMFSGSITGASIATNQLRSIATSADAPNGYIFSINPGGYAEFAGVRSYGNMIVGNSTSHMISSGNYSPGSAGWRIYGSGDAEFNGAYIKSYNFTAQNVDGSGTTNINSAYLSITSGSGGFVKLSYGEVDREVGLSNYWSGLWMQWPGYKITLGKHASSGQLQMHTTHDLTFTRGILVDGGVIITSLGTGGARNSNNGIYYTRATSDGTLYSWTTGPSSRDIKHDIGELDVDVKKVLQMHPVTYRFNEAPLEKRAGFIAEEVDEMGLEFLVGYKDETAKEGAAGFDYDGMDAVLLKVDQYQEGRIDAQEREIAELKELVKSLSERLDK